MQRVGWVVMVVLSSLVAAYVAILLLMPQLGPPFLNEMRSSRPLAMYAHFAGGMWALAVGPWQFHQRLRDRALSWHRWLGRSYVLAVGLGGLGALSLAPFAQTGVVASIGFGALGGLWLWFTAAAFRQIRRGNREAHRQWMVRSFALTLAAVTLRVYLPFSFAAQVPFEAAYPTIAWLCWVPNLIVAEWYLKRRRGLPSAQTST